jgi:hypothetical protein
MTPFVPADVRGEPARAAELPTRVMTTRPPTPAITVPRVREGQLPRFEGYEVLGELGRGGMEVVYKARQTLLNRVVALKMVLGGAFADEERVVRFQREAEAVARLQHPAIVQIFEVGVRHGLTGDGFRCPTSPWSSSKAVASRTAWVRRDRRPRDLIDRSEGHHRRHLLLGR